MRATLSSFALVFLSLFQVNSQDLRAFSIIDTIEIRNGSFEQLSEGENPFVSEWSDCGDTQKTPPTVFVNGDPLLRSNEIAQDGIRFMTLVTRDDSTWEAVAQSLTRPLQAGKNYVIKCFIRRSYLESEADLIAQKESIEPPIVFKLHSIGEIKEQAIDRNNILEELGESDLIIEKDWEEHTFVFRPKKEVNILMIEAFYQVPVLLPYNGHLFIDNISPIYEVE
jgi:hypothetical protein